jgi:Ras-related GTP-binding protein A/B
VHTLIPNAAVLSRHLTTFAEACNATEVILFERTTFLVIATSAVPTAESSLPVENAPESPADTTGSSVGTTASSTSSYTPARPSATGASDGHALEPTRYERTSELVKAFKHACARVRAEFRALELEGAEFTAVLDELTKNMYVLVIAHDPTIGGIFPYQDNSQANRCVIQKLQR